MGLLDGLFSAPPLGGRPARKSVDLSKQGTTARQDKKAAKQYRKAALKGEIAQPWGPKKGKDAQHLRDRKPSKKLLG